MTRGLELYRSMPRYAAARVLSSRVPSLAGAAATSAAPLRLVDRGDPALPGRGWVTVRPSLAGICGSDLATVTGQSSFYFSPLVSMPFTPGHEVVGTLQSDAVLADGTVYRAGSRVVIDPVLGCEARGLDPCVNCVAGLTSRCDRVTVGHLSPGLQTGYCKDTGGGWSRAMVAHLSQLHPVPGDLPDERAVLVEPLATAVHTAGRARVAAGDRVLVIGSGAVGLFTLLALRAYTPAAHITVVAKHRRQVELARAFGADEVLSPSDALGGVRRATRALRAEPELGGPYLLGGVDVAVDCAGSASSLSTALRVTRAGGRVVLSGVPSGSVDLTPLWYRELELVGTYASSGRTGRPAAGEDGPLREPAGAGPAAGLDGDGGARSDFGRAFALAASAPLDGVVSAVYPLARWREALDHALSAGRLGAVKIAFDPTMSA
ncbi:zinc-binding dehydrogenase [Frankia sp. CNm7]|uniref:Zinc-binding dehydrogenase n=1 Tax=Frankia nepalensis TaxID=1836974 RepID=A0A937RA93_9ACTN|nr:zinc-binding dehydrogenase [Frankia nepalensis]MBL7495208.1 zinc-binding dehydrogenase [Frankia nepalensis]MBL7515739.1 zinc-binding dehydrogenase [Frankia nepalensis]MBL7518918.1 zinc-binding dehydrogenase [Frankia nepalensis]MBL7628326.1 zinc-binding dehydrogenase [Frankia nepalensis]